MPLFAFANAGVPVLGNARAALAHPVAVGVLIGLCLGKPIGITSFAWVAAKCKAAIRAGVTWTQIFGASCLCGIGFTMSLFIAGLAFGEGMLLDMAKIGTLSASLVSGAAGTLVRRKVR